MGRTYAGVRSAESEGIGVLWGGAGGELWPGVLRPTAQLPTYDLATMAFAADGNGILFTERLQSALLAALLAKPLLFVAWPWFVF